MNFYNLSTRLSSLFFCVAFFFPSFLFSLCNTTRRLAENFELNSALHRVVDIIAIDRKCSSQSRVGTCRAAQRSDRERVFSCAKNNSNFVVYRAGHGSKSRVLHNSDTFMHTNKKSGRRWTNIKYAPYFHSTLNIKLIDYNFIASRWLSHVTQSDSHEACTRLIGLFNIFYIRARFRSPRNNQRRSFAIDYQTLRRKNLEQKPMAKAQRSQNDILFIFRRRRRRVERNNNKLDGLKKKVK